MKDIFDYLHEQDEDLDHLPRVELLESEKKDALRYIRMREKESADEDCFCEQKDSAEERNPKTMKKSTRRSTIAAVLAAALAVGGTAYTDCVLTADSFSAA